MLRKWTVLGLMLSALATAAAAATDAAGPVISGAGARRGVDVTVYNQDMALVRETRTVDLPAGDVRLEFRDVPARINPVTLLVTGGADGRFELLEQNYEFDLLSRERILAK